MAVPCVGRRAGMVPAGGERLSLVPGHEQGGPGQPLWPPGRVAADGQVRKKEAGKKPRIASANCSRYDTATFGPPCYAMAVSKNQSVPEARTSPIPISCARQCASMLDGVAWHRGGTVVTAWRHRRDSVAAPSWHPGFP